MKLTDFRKQYPEYNDLSDAELAKGIHQKFYSDMPFESFSKEIGFTKAEEPSFLSKVGDAISGAFKSDGKPLAEKYKEAETIASNKSLRDKGLLQATGKPTPFKKEPLDTILARNQAGKFSTEANESKQLKEGAEIVDGMSGVAKVGAMRGYAGLGDQMAGAVQYLADLTGFETLDKAAKDLSKTAEKRRGQYALRGDKVEGFAGDSIVQDLPEAGSNAIASVASTAPALGMGALTGTALPTIFATSGASEYLEGRKQGLSPEKAMQRAIPMASFEVIGEKIGGTERLAKALKDAADGNGVADLGLAMIAGGLREQPGEQVTTAGQFVTDLLPEIGLNQDATFDDYKKAVKDTALSTMLQGGAMAGGGAILANQEKPKGLLQSQQDVLKVGNEQTNAEDDAVAAQKQAAYEAEQKRYEQQTNADAAMAGISQAQSVDDAILLATEAINTPLSEGLDATDLVDDTLLEQVQQFTGGENVSNSTEQQVTEMATQAAGTELDNGQGSARGLLPQSAERGLDNVTKPLGTSGTGDIQRGTDESGMGSEALGGKTNSLSRDSSWVIRNKETGEVIQETFQKSVADKVNTDKYEAIPIQQHLAEMNDPNSKVRKFASGEPLGNSEQLPAKLPSNPRQLVGNADNVNNTLNNVPNTLNDVPNTLNDANSESTLAQQLENAPALSSTNTPESPVNTDLPQSNGEQLSQNSENNISNLTAKQKLAKRKKTYKPQTLATRLNKLGGITLRDRKEITGEAKRLPLGGYKAVFTKDSQMGLQDLIDDGLLDDYLPFEMRASTSKARTPNQVYDSQQAYEYLADRIGKGERVLPYEVELEIQEKAYNAQADIQLGASIYSDDEINALLREAGYDEREESANSRIYETSPDETLEVTEQQSTDSNVIGNERSQAGTTAETRNEVTETTGSNGTERESARPLVETIVKRRAIANQIGKSKPFDDYLQAAKDFLNGKEIKPARFKLASTAFKNDAPLSEAYAQLAELAKQPAKESRKANTDTVQGYRDLIANTNRIDSLKAIARDIQDETVLSDAQVQELDDLVMDKIDVLEQPEAQDVAEPETDVAESETRTENINFNGFEIYKVKTASGEMWAVQSVENKARGVIKGFGNALEETLDDAKKTAIRQLKDYEDRQKEKAEAEKELTEKNKQAELAKAEIRNLEGFADGLPDVQQRRIEEILNKPASLNGVVKTRRQHIKDMVNAGRVVKEVRGERILEADDGFYFDEGAITKTGMDFAEYLISKKPNFTLTQETNEEILAREQAQKDAEAEKAKAEAKAKAEEEKRALEAQQRKNAAERPFEFGEDTKRAEQAIKSGSEDMFAQADDNNTNAEIEKAKKDLNDALGDLGDIFGSNFRANMLPEQEQKLLPVLTRLFDAAFRLGYNEFKQAAKFVLDTIRSKLGNDVADAVTIDHLQGAYIGMAGKYGDKATKKRDVINVETKEEIERTENVNDLNSRTDMERDSENANASNSVGETPIQNERAGTSGSRGQGIPSTQANRQPNSSGSLFDSKTIDTRERGNSEIYTGAAPTQRSIARDNDNRGSSDNSLTGTPIEPEATAGINNVAESGLFRLKAPSEQKQADKIPQERTLENIQKTLPLLKSGQQEDVLKAENKFAEPEGYGMLFTNGTGTGKTFTGLGVVKRFANNNKNNILIVAPNDKIIEDWQNTAKLFGLTVNRLENTNDAGKGIVITTYSNLGANETLADREWDLVVADEAHYLAMDKDGTNTNALLTVRAITLNPQGAYKRYQMKNRDMIAEVKRLNDAIESNSRTINNDDTMEDIVISLRKSNERMEKQLEDFQNILQQNQLTEKLLVEENQGEKRTRALFLSATPFAYEKSIDWANGYLFDYNEGKAKDEDYRGYNVPNNMQAFFIEKFGYRMRYNKLTSPDATVNSGLMQRQFNTWLKKRGTLSGRMLDVDADYDRKFVLIDSAIGTRIDQALAWFNDKRTVATDPKTRAAISDVERIISEQFDYLTRRYLLEAIKAKEVIVHVKEHMALGRKVVVFHDYKKGGGFNPFNIKPRAIGQDATQSGDTQLMNTIIAEFREEFSDLINSPELDASSPIDAFTEAFPNVLLFNGDVPTKTRRANVAKFQDDASGPQVILVQSAAGKEGISLHDTTGKHQRVLFNLGQPTQPTTSIQQEGRIYRTGQVTDAIFRYLNTGTSWEKWAFATTIAQRASAAENLALGEQARALKDAFISGFEESDNYRAGMEGEGKGGKERDKAANEALTEYDRAKAFYYGTAKKTSKTKAQEGADYFATPEPVGLKMVELADIRAGERVLEPSAGHGAIARWFPEGSDKTAIEPSHNLRPRLAMVFEGKINGGNFEDLNIVNKYDAIIMNPPFGTAGKTAIDHLAKATQHLKDGGRVVALIPVGSTDKKFDKWFYETDTRKAKPLGETEKAGEFYAGDIVELEGRDGTYKIESRHENGNLLMRPMAGGIPEGYRSHYIARIVKQGARTEEYRPAEGLSLVAEIKLPSVTFERAGTAVNTRIVVIEKSENAPQQTNRDYTQVTDINDLFDRMETLAIAPRAKPMIEEAEGATTSTETKPVDASPIESGFKLGEFKHTQTGAMKYVATLEKRVDADEFKRIGTVAKANNGYYSRYNGGGAISGYLFDNTDDRDAFVNAFNQDASFSNTPTFYSEPQLFTVQQVREAIKNDIYGQDVDVYESLEQAPQYIQDQARSERAYGVEGYFDKRTNKVAIIANNIESLERAKEVARHELIGHYGIENMMTKPDFEKVLDRIKIARRFDPELKEIAKYVLDNQSGLRITSQDTPEKRKSKEKRIAKEVIAVMAERNMQNNGIWQRIVDAVKVFLNKIGFIKGEITTNEITRLLRDSQRYLAKQGRSVVEGSESSFSQTNDTKQAYEQRIDELFNGKKSDFAELGAKVLDKSDVLDLLGYGDKPVYLNEKKVTDGKFNHGLKAEHWKKIPEWLENPVLVFESDTVKGRLVMIAPEKVNGSPVRLIIDPDAKNKGLKINLLVNAYDAHGKTPFTRWINEGLLRYYNKTKSLNVLTRSELQLLGMAKSRGTGVKILRDTDLVKYRAENSFSNADTITVDGKQRPTTNSNGKPIHPTRAMWFGYDSMPKSFSDVVLARESAMSKSRPDSNASNTEFISDLLISPAFTSQGLGGLEVPAQRKVLNSVLFFGNDSQVLRSIIQFIPIDVMNILASENLPTESLFSNKSVLSKLLSVDSKGSVTTAIDVANSLVFAVARMATEDISIFSRMPSGNAKQYSTTNAGVLDYPFNGDGLSVGVETNFGTKGFGRVFSLSDKRTSAVSASFGVRSHEGSISKSNQIGNTGSFDSNNDSILFSNRNLDLQRDKAFESLDDTTMTKIARLLQDKNIDLKNVQKQIKQNVGEIADRFNPYLQEELYHGRAAKRTKDFIEKELNPLITEMRVRGVKLADFEEYLWMRHAPERNAKMAEINEGNPDGLAGVSTQEALDYMDNLPAQDKAKYEALARKFDAIVKRTNQTLVNYQLESQATIDAWNATYKHYAPLMREEMENGTGNGTGQGFKVRGNSTKQATGSRRAVVDILANVAQARERAIIRGEKNRVATALIGLVKTYPNDDFWKADTPPTVKAVNKATGLVEVYTDPNYKSRENVMVARIADRLGNIQERSVTFNKFDERAMNIALSMQNLDVDNMDAFLTTVAMGTRWISSVNTQYNPVFGLFNLWRDAQAVALNLSSTPLAGKQKEVLTNGASALRGIFIDIRDTRNGVAPTSQWALLWEEFQREGGQTGYRDQFKNASERTKAIEHALDPQWWAKSKLGKALTLNGFATVPIQYTLDARFGAKAIFGLLSDYNETLENAMRLSTYKVALDNGMTKQQAASLAKNISVNFNRKGQAGRNAGALYAFFNASVQGTARLAETIAKDGKLSAMGKKVVYGGMLLGAIQALALKSAGFDDEEPPEFIKDRNIVIPVGDGKYVTWALPLGFNVFPAAGRIGTELMLDGFREPSKKAIHLIEVFMDMFNPIGNAGMSLQTVMPSVIDPAIALVENRDWNGMPIYKEDFNSLDETPGFTRSKDTATWFAKGLSYGFNALTGGDEDVAGKFSPTPDQIDYLVGQVTGGVGRELSKAEQTITSMATDEELPTYKIPLVGRLYGDTKGAASQGSKYYANIIKMNRHKRKLEGMQERGEDTAQYLSENKEAELVGVARRIDSNITKLKRMRKVLKENNASADELRAVNDRITELMTQLNTEVEEAR